MTKSIGDLKLIQTFPELHGICSISSHEDGKEFLAMLYKENFIRRFINYEAQALLEDSGRIPIGSDGAVSIAATEERSLVLRYFDPDKSRKKPVGNHGYLYSQSSDMLFLLASEDPITIKSYRFFYDSTRSVQSNFLSMELEPPEYLTLHQGQTFLTIANRDVVDYMGLDSKVLLLALTSPNADRFNFAFDPNTRKAVQIIATDNEDSRLEYVSQLLAALEAREAVPQLLIRLSHPNPSVRWRLARDILQLNQKAGEEVIARLAVDDVDVHVRTSARKSLEILKGMHIYGL